MVGAELILTRHVSPSPCPLRFSAAPSLFPSLVIPATQISFDQFSAVSSKRELADPRPGHGARLHSRSEPPRRVERRQRHRARQSPRRAYRQDVGSISRCSPSLPSSFSLLHSLSRSFTSAPAGTTMTCHRMAEKGIYLTPTLSCYGTMARPPFEDFLNPEGQVKNRQVMQQGLQALKVARPSCSLRSCCADWMGW
jgi:hypothetical protein